MNSITHRYNRYDVFIFLLIVTLIFGNFGGALMIVRVLAILLLPVMLSKYNRKMTYVKSYFSFFIVFYYFCILSLLWTPNIEQATKELVYYLVHFFIFIEILIFSRFSKSPLKTISLSWVISVSLTLIVAVWEITTSQHLYLSKFEADDIALNFDGVRIERPFAAVTFGNFNGYVTYLCFAMPFLFYSILKYKKDFKKILICLSVLLVSVITILVNASRGGFLSILFMSSILFFNTKHSWYKTLLLIITIVLVVYFIIPRMDTLFLTLSVKSEGNNLISDESRMAIWGDSLRVLLDYGLIGCGIGGLIDAIKNVSTTGLSIPHNMFLEIIVQYGLFFFTIFLFFIIKLFKKAWQEKDVNIKTLLYMAILAMPIYGIIDSGYLLNPIFYVAFASIVVFAYNKTIHPLPST